MEIKILISYRMMIGSAIIICVATSGGVKIADRINEERIANLRYFFIKSGVIRPILVIKRTTTGISKTRPNAKSNLIAKEKYCFTDGSAWMSSVAKLIKNLKP